jgi:hypothetical protein
MENEKKALDRVSSEYESFSSNENKEKGKGRQNNEKRRTLNFYQNLYGKFYKDDEYSFARMDTVLNMPTLSAE